MPEGMAEGGGLYTSTGWVGTSLEVQGEVEGGVLSRGQCAGGQLGGKGALPMSLQGLRVGEQSGAQAMAPEGWDGFTRATACAFRRSSW